MENNVIPQWLLRSLAISVIVYIGIATINQLSTWCASPQIMHVSAEGKITAVPNIATVTIGVISEGVDAIAVKNLNNQQINRIIALLKNEKIDAHDIQTTTFSASPKYNYNNGQSNIIGYQATQSVTVKIRTLEQSRPTLEKILSDVVNNNNITIQGIDFNFSDTEKLKAAARKKAIVLAKEKANNISIEANLKLGKIVNVVFDSTNSTVNPISARAMLSASTMQAKSIQPQIEPGHQEIIENITLLFEVYKK